MKKQDKEIKETISIEQARKDLQKIVGLPVARAWKGYGTISFLELGELHRQGYIGKEWKERQVQVSIKGDWTLSHLWNWRIIRNNIVEFDSFKFSEVAGKVGATAKLKPVAKALEQLEGAKIISVELNDSGTALSIVFNTGIELQTNRHKDFPDEDFFKLIYNHNPFLVFGEKNSIYYWHNDL